MKKTFLFSLTAVIMVVFLSGCGPSKQLSLAERQQHVLNMKDEALQKLYQEQPSTRQEVANAPGYGVFSNANINIIFASAGGGYGVVVDNSTGKNTFMKMGLGGVGLGIGAKDYRQILIFRNKTALDKFVLSGWDFGGHADAAAKAGQSGGEMSGEGDFSENITVYSLTESGLALQATVHGAKYWVADDLNK